MTKKTRILHAGAPALLAGLFLCPVWLAASPAPAERVLFDFTRAFDLGQARTNHALVSFDPGQGLTVKTTAADSWPGVTLPAPGGFFDLSRYNEVTVALKNVGANEVTVSCRVDNPGADGSKNCVTGNLTLAPGASGTLRIALSATPWRLSEKIELVGMRGWPGQGQKIDPAKINQLLLFVGKPKAAHAFQVKSIRAEGAAVLLDAKTFFPFIDEFGQFRHADWPGKVKSPTDLVSRIQIEEQDLAAHPGPSDRNAYGGWTGGPVLKATGFFRVEKHQGKWWLVDPEGRLFWSHGIDCVRVEAATPITDREHYFHLLPGRETPLGRFYGSGNWAPHGYYQGKGAYKTYDFSGANLWRKHGPDFESKYPDLVHRRLKSWGLNTIANWSSSKIYGLRQTPYTATLSFNAKAVEGSKGYWGKFYDVFDPDFAANCRQAVAREKGKAIGDPWCIGFYVHNELAWGEDTSLAVAALVSPPNQAAKAVFIEDLKAKYRDIGTLNQAWGANHVSWEALRQSTNSPDVKKAGLDLRAFYTKFAETYFRIVRDELKAAAPNQLYLGCRFAWVNDLAAKAATKYADVISYNRYSYSVADQKLPEGIDLPIIIGEFHFGALDRGMFHTGLKKTASQQDRALKYLEYVQGALRNPLLVGTHWFQYKDQATTGRGDGENYQIGFVDICDTPYPEIIAASRQIGREMYPYRMK